MASRGSTFVSCSFFGLLVSFLPLYPSRPVFRELSHAAVDVGKSLFPLFALALDLSEDFFDDKVRTPIRQYVRKSNNVDKKLSCFNANVALSTSIACRRRS